MGNQLSSLKLTKTSLHFLILGQSGVGKTALFNFFANLTHGKTPASYKAFHTETNEGALNDQRWSQTKQAQRYSFLASNGLQVTLIDTPGLADTDGFEKDKDNIKSIIDSLRAVRTLDAVLVIANGTCPRLDQVTRYVMSELQSIFPKSILENLILLLTNCTPSTSNFDKKTLGFDVKNRIFYLQNPFSLWTKMKSDFQNGTLTLEEKEARMDEITASHQTSQICVEKLLKCVNDMKKVATNEFVQVYEKKCAIELKIIEGVLYINQMEQSKMSLRQIQKDLDLASSDRQRVADKLKDIIQTSMTVQVDTEPTHNTLCGLCSSNCHLGCTTEYSLDKEVIKKCSKIGGDLCQICGHSYTHHFHGMKKWETKVLQEEKVNSHNLSIFDDATLQIHNKSKSKNEIQILIDSHQSKADQRRKEIATLLEEYKAHCLVESFDVYTQNILDLTESRMNAESNPEIRQILRSDIETLKTKIRLLKNEVSDEVPKPTTKAHLPEQQSRTPKQQPTTPELCRERVSSFCTRWPKPILSSKK